jgi:hypothetical protein
MVNVLAWDERQLSMLNDFLIYQLDNEKCETVKNNYAALLQLVDGRLYEVIKNKIR